MFPYILLALAGLIAVVVIAAATRPDQYRVARTIVIKASPAAVFDHCNDLAKYMEWNPFGKMEPEAKQTLSATTSGVGSSLAWEGKRIGAGTMTTIESKPNELLRYKMEFLRPMAEVAEARFEITAAGSHTEITWSVNGTNSFMRKLIGLVLNFDKMIGGSFASGLRDLKSVVESANPV